MSNHAVEVRIYETTLSVFIEFVDDVGFPRRYNRITGASIQRLIGAINRDCVVQIDASPDTLYKYGFPGIVARRKQPSEDAKGAEIERLRAALADIAHGPVGYWNLPEHHAKVIRDMIKTAEKALRGE